MLEIETEQMDFWDEAAGEFVVIKPQKIQLEHSLISLSKWEATWCKPFLSNDNKTDAETLDYVRCMTINKNVNPLVYTNLGRANLEKVNAYVLSKQTATTIHDPSEGRAVGSRKVYTSELIYSWMVSYNIPLECEKWFLNRLITLIRIIQIENQPKKKQSMSAIAARNRALNAARRKELGTHG